MKEIVKWVETENSIDKLYLTISFAVGMEFGKLLTLLFVLCFTLQVPHRWAVIRR